MAEIIQVSSNQEIETVKTLFLEYATWLGFELCFQGFDEELATLPGKYAPPNGRLYIVQDDDKIAGCIALREFKTGISEMKRLYVKPEFRGKGIGNIMVEKVIQDAIEIGYKKMLLDTIGDKMSSAIKIYKSFGFKEIPAYYKNPEKGVVYMELDLKNSK